MGGHVLVTEFRGISLTLPTNTTLDISDNEKADQQQSCLSNCHSMKIPATDLVPCVTKLISDKWQQLHGTVAQETIKL